MMIVILILVFTLPAWSSDETFYQSVFKSYSELKELKISDPISDEPTNTTLLQVKKENQTIGFIREITTTTGCNSACLPLIYTTFYDAKGNFLKLKSRDGLTKKNHAPMTAEDYARLEMIVLFEDKEFDSIVHPKEMTDAISGETIKKYQGKVVPEAAYSTLRVHVYNKQTKNEIKRILKSLK